MDLASRFRVQADSFNFIETFPKHRYYVAGETVFNIPNINISTLDERVVPFFVAVLTFLVQLLYFVFHYSFGSKELPELQGVGEVVIETRHVGVFKRLKKHIRHYGGYIIYGFMLVRLASVLSLVYLTNSTLSRCNNKPRLPEDALAEYCPEYFLGLTFIYSAILATLSLIWKSWHTATTRANNIILLSAFGVYAFRDLWPLATYTLEPKDEFEGNLIWAKIAILAFAAIFIPLFIPRQYYPVDPKHPMPLMNPELTASWISRLTFTYVEPIVALGSKVDHVRHDQLPPLVDEDWAVNQRKWSFPYVDPFGSASRRYLFWGLFIHFRREYVIMGISTTLMCLLEFVSPIGINRVLDYLETGGSKDSDIKPWFWIAWLLLGPVLASVATHWYLYYLTIIRIRTEAIVTQLVFEHSLRIRLKAEAGGDSPGSSTTTPSGSQPASKAASVISADEDEFGDTADHATRSDNGTSVTEASTVVGESSRVASEATVTAPTKKKGKATPSTDAGQASPEEKKPASENLLGKINNYVTSDLQNILEGLDFLVFFFNVPLQIILCTAFLYKILGWSSIVGLLATILLSPVVGVLGSKVQTVQIEKMKMTDSRVQSITEAVGILRMIKLFGWEIRMNDQVKQRREDELAWMWKMKVVKLLIDCFSMFIPTITMLITYVAYTVIMKETLTASKIFSSMVVFSMLREQLHRISWQSMLLIEGKVSLDRVSNFLQTAELLDSFAEIKESSKDVQLAIESNKVEDTRIGFKNATFAWSLEEDGTLTPSTRTYRLHIDEELLFKRGRINLIVGPTGSGKTSMLMALLGEMHSLPSTPDSWFNLPRGEGVAYAAQESWVQNATIKDNILFGSPYDEDRYKKVLEQCALERDLELFDAGDATEVGERGLTLSGGQKARVTLARAIYSPAKIILLDDVLAALDVHTSAWIVDKCFKGDLVKGRTILLVTHNVALAGPVADFVVSLSLDGRVRTQGTELSVPLKADPKLAAEVAQDQKATEAVQETETVDEPQKKSDGKLIMAEEIAHGHVSWKSMKLFILGLGGDHPVLFSLIVILGLFVSSGTQALEPWFMGVWGSQYETHHPSEVNLAYYITIFSLIALLNILMDVAINLYYNYRSIAASRSIHAQLIESIFGATLRWLDETPAARIIARCTQDIRSVDGPLAQDLWWVVSTFLTMITRLGAIVIFTPVFLPPGILVAVVGMYIGNLYLKTQLCVKREMSNARSPLLAHLSAAIHGIVSIRAYGAQESFKDESLKRIDFYSTAARTSWNINRWVGFRIDLLGAAFTASLAAFLVYGKQVGASNTGFSLNMASSFCMMIFWLIRIYNNLEVESNSLERIQAYIEIDHEPKPVESGKPPAAWPTSGDLRVEKLSARYSQTGPKVLHDISFHIKSGQRIGIVGRTGSGKSSLTLALLRCILTEGAVFYDGVSTSTINLDALRSNITIIPQTPELISGTLRQNLDPFDQHDDAPLNDALRSAGLFTLQEDAGDARLTLDTKIAGGGGNLSVGQRQIIALARAMVRGSKLLILDEATSAIDYKTDTIIQNTLRSQLPSDVTVITVAHRLQTIMDADKIMVLDAGRIAEFDSPKVLLTKEKGLLKSLVDGSGDAKALYALAGK